MVNDLKIKLGDLSSEELSLLYYFRQCSNEGQSIVLEIVRGSAEREQSKKWKILK